MELNNLNFYDTLKSQIKKTSKKAWLDEITWTIAENIAKYYNHCLMKCSKLLFEQNKIRQVFINKE